MMRAIVRILRVFPPEPAHHAAVAFLRVMQASRRYLPSLFRIGSALIKLPPGHTRQPTICLRGLSFANRLGLAAGFDKNAEVFAGLAQLGFGFIEVGTVTPRPQSGNPKPRLFRVGRRSLVNRMGFNNCGLEVFRANLQRYRQQVPELILLANIGRGRNTPNESAIDDYRMGFSSLKDWADGFVVNVSSPNTPGLAGLQNQSFLRAIAGIAPVGKPVLIKLSPDLESAELENLLQVVNEGDQLAGVVLTNTSRNLAQARFPEGGGWSGPELLEFSLQSVRRARSVLLPDKIIVGVGGVSSALDFERMREAGADLVEVYTAFVYQGPAIVSDLVRMDQSSDDMSE